MPAFGDTNSLARAGDVSDHRIGIDIDDAGADRNLERHVLPFRSTLFSAHSRFAVLGTIQTLIAVIDQCVERLVALNKDRTTAAAITTVRSPFGNVFFAAEAEATVATLTCFYPYYRLIDEFHDLPP